MELTKKNICILFSALAVSLSLAVGFSSTEKSNNQRVFGEEMPNAEYTIAFYSSLNKLDVNDGVSSAFTARGNDIRFAHHGLSSNNYWRRISNGGYFQNVDPINGLKYIRIDYLDNENAKLSVSYGWDDNMIIQSELSSSQIYAFNNSSPTYVRIDNLSGRDIDISAIEIGFSCSGSVKPDIDGTFVSEIKEDKYVIDVKALTLSNVQNAYQHALNLNESQLEHVNEILINLPAGSINLNDTLSFSGVRNNNTPIRFKGDNTAFIGGDEIIKGNWSLYQNDVYRTFIGTNLDKFSSLIVNGEAKVLAKTKDLTFTYSYDNRKIQFKKSQYDISSMTGNCQIVTLERWAECIGAVESFSSSGFLTTTFTLNLDNNGEYVFYDASLSYRPNSTTEIAGYLQDNLFFLDDVGEWYYSKDDGYLYYKPENSFSINSDSFIIPKVETLLSTENLVDDVTFDGIMFNGSNYSRPLEIGFIESQTSWFIDPETKESALISGMVEIQSENTSFSNCVFKNSSNIGVHINNMCEEVTLYNNEIINSGAGAIYVGYPTHSRFGFVPQNIKIENNVIDNFGCFYKGGPGICAAYVDELYIFSNTIQNGGYSGITAGWGWLSDQSTYGHNNYHISYNRISNIMNSAFHDGGGIYVLGNFPNQLNELFNEISYNYIEVNYLLNGGIYLDEGSSSWDINHNVINVTANDLTYHGVIMMHDPIDANTGTNISQFANHITNNYYRGDVDGTENQSQLTYQNNGGSYYSGDALANYNNQRNIVFDTPILGNDTYVNNDIYQASGHKDCDNILLSNESIFERYITGTTNLVLNSNGQATFNVTGDGFVLTSEYINFLLKQGYSGLSFDITATSLNSTEAVYAVCFSSGTLSWQEFYTQSLFGKSIIIPLNKFNVDGATCMVKIRDVNGLNQDNNLPATVTISNVKLSKFSTIKTGGYGDITLVSSNENAATYSIKNISYDWIRILFLGMKDALNKGYGQVRISIKGNNHNLYVFKSGSDSEIDYNNRILAGGGSVVIDLDNNDKNIAIMTSHENYNVPGDQDDSGIYGRYENLVITYKFIKSSFEDTLLSKKTLSRYIGEITLHSIENGSPIISFTNSRMRINHNLIKEMIESGVSSFEFDLVVPENSDVKSIVSCWYGGPNNADVSYNSVGVFSINNHTIHVVFDASTFNNCYDIQLVSRDEDAYSGIDINLERAVITNLIFNY